MKSQASYICACSVLQIASESSLDLLLSAVGLQEESWSRAVAGGHVAMYGVIAHSYLDFVNTILSESSRHFIIGHVKMTSRVIITPCYLGKNSLVPRPHLSRGNGSGD